MTKLKQEQDNGVLNYAMQHTDDQARCFECNEHVTPMTVIGEGGAVRMVELCDNCLPIVVKELWPDMTESEHNKLVEQLKEA